MNSQSDKFVLHQYNYYGQYVGGRRGHDEALIGGLYRRAADECLKRGLIVVDSKTNAYKIVERIETNEVDGGSSIQMRIETVHGRHLVCGGLLPAAYVKPSQTWAAADGSNRTVQIEEAGDWVKYSWLENGVKKVHSKLNTAFQCRYCLVVDSPEVPHDLG